MTANELLHEGVKHQFNHIPPGAPPMAILSATLSNLACYHQEFLALEDEGSLEEVAARLISKVRTIAAFSYRRSLGLPFIYPDPHLRYCANFLHMMFSLPYKQYIVTREVEDALNLLFILHGDHEQNCSSSTVRIVGSAKANLFASCAAAVCALWGPLHGGANVEVMDMLDRIHRGGLSPEDCLRHAKDKTNPFRLYGFGHRVYRNYDPRAKILKEACDRVFAQIKRQDPLLSIARKLEELALADPYFIDRQLYPNVDFYSGILLRAMGIPDQHVHRLFRHRPAAGLDRPMEGAARRSDHENPASAANLHRTDRDKLPSDGKAMNRGSPGRRSMREESRVLRRHSFRSRTNMFFLSRSRSAIPGADGPR